MLKLRKVELFGFKSFFEKTPITFSGTGITCIVGPNGCGKSNVVDAISWVLGEQSHKMLRAERMSDCIFNGTAKRPPMGLSEVTLTLVDPELSRGGGGGDGRAGGRRGAHAVRWRAARASDRGPISLTGSEDCGTDLLRLARRARHLRQDESLSGADGGRWAERVDEGQAVEEARRRKSGDHDEGRAKWWWAGGCIARGRANM